jgi:hypothetical protein
MSPRPGTLILDDGELRDVRAALDQIGVEYTYLRGGAVEGIRVEMPRQLLVATPRRALALRGGGRKSGNDPVGPGQRPPVRIVVTSEDSNALRDQLREVGFDYLVRRPIHPGALRLLLLRALYRGPERRVTVRYPVGGVVLYRTGLRRRRATLLEISLRGCRLQAERPAEPDTRISVILPKEFTDARPVSLPGWALRSNPTADGEFEIAVAFEALRSSAERNLRLALKRKIRTPEVLPREAAREPGSASPHAEIRDRRESPRGSFQGEVLAHRDEAERALVGRNLSTGGMLVEQNLELRLGDEATLAIFGRDGEDPLEVRARVVRDDENGMALQFFDVDPDDAERLEALVAQLPSVERLADTETEAMGTVVAQIVLGRDAVE